MPFRPSLILGLLLGVVLLASIARGQATAPASEANAAQAKQKYDDAVAKADENQSLAVGAAREPYLEALRAAYKSAMADAKLELATWCKTEIESVEAGNPASAERAKLYVVAKAQEAFTRATERAGTDRLRAAEAARKQYIVDLEAAKRVTMAQSGDLEEASRISKEIERVKALGPSASTPPAASVEKPTARVAITAAPAETRGLKFEWFKGENFNVRIGERVEAKIAAEFGGGTPGLGGDHERYSVRWTGYIRAPKPGRYQLHAAADDGFRLKLDGKTVMEGWDGGGWQHAWVDFTNEPMEIVYEMRNGGGPGSTVLLWSHPGEKAGVVIPATAFYLTRKAAESGQWLRPAGQGLTMLVFDDLDLRNQVTRGIDDNIDWPLGGCAFAQGLRRDNMAFRWEGFLAVPATGIYKFIVGVDDGFRLAIDRKVLINAWGGGNHSQTITAELEEGAHSILVEYCMHGPPNYVTLRWMKSEGFEEQIIPPSAFFLTKGAAEQAIARRKAGGK